ncbi:MAG: TIR domain-containing protein [Acidobacteriota bacterium]
MTDPQSPRTAGFVAGGSLAPESPVYVERRRLDRTVRRLMFKEKRSVTLYGPRQVGKTSLLRRIENQARSDYGYATTRIDLSTLNDDSIPADRWCLELHRRIVDDVAPWLDDADPAPDPPSSPVDLKLYWQRWAGHPRIPRLLVLLDEASSVPLAIGATFYSTIRVALELETLGFLMAGVFEPRLLVKKSENSPFNVTRNLWLEDFEPTEIEPLVARLVAAYDLAPDSSIAAAVERWTRGQPFLTQALLSLLDEQLEEGGARTAAEVDFVEDAIPRLREMADHNISHVVQVSLREDMGQRRMIERLLAGERVHFSRSNRAIAELALAGSVRENRAGLCEIRNPLYRWALERALEPDTASNVDKAEARPEVFLSYSWKSGSKAVAERIDRLLQERGVTVLRDERDIGYRGSIREFMQRLGRGHAVILVISDAYLRSKACMFELCEVFAHGSFRERIFPIVLSDAKIYDAEDLVDYVLFWRDKRRSLSEKLQQLGDEIHAGTIRADLALYDRIGDMIDRLSAILRDMLTYRESQVDQLPDEVLAALEL